MRPSICNARHLLGPPTAVVLRFQRNAVRGALNGKIDTPETFSQRERRLSLGAGTAGEWP